MSKKIIENLLLFAVAAFLGSIVLSLFEIKEDPIIIGCFALAFLISTVVIYYRRSKQKRADF